ncbi:oxidoreductase [uncultured Vagococcus sp.]|uniref:oxidoreductase n=1 Tax=uncultured Vagococcus sp. TaxID=189676 RepID=UPI0028D16B86|nr:oxidoreductase [uncultured Vagococcus sp.]
MILKMAIIGFGKSATRYHLPYLAIRDKIQVKYVCDVNYSPEKEDACRNLGCQFTNELNQLLDDPEIRLITLCTPPESHYELAKRCLAKGKHLIVEKPFCQTVAETEEVLALAKEAKLLAIPYQNRRFDSDYLTLKEVLKSGYVGRPVELEAHVDYFRPDKTIKVGHPLTGNFYGLGVHQIDQMVALFGEPHTVGYEIGNNQHPESAVDDYYDIRLYYEQFKVIVKTSQLVAAPYPRFLLHGTHGSYLKYGMDQQENDLKLGILPGASHFGEDSPEAYGKVTYQNQNGDWIHKSITSQQGDYGAFYDSAYDTLIHQKPPIVTADQIITTIKLLEQGFKQKNPSVFRWAD